MATQPTNKDIGSEDPRDLKFNAGKIDEFVNSVSLTYMDRKNNTRLTINGLEEAAVSAGPTVEAAIRANDSAREAERISNEILAQTEGYINSAKQSASDSAASAGASEASAQESKQYAEAAEAKTDIGGTYPDTVSGIAATAVGGYFRVPQGTGSKITFIWYTNNNGAAVEVASSPSSSYVDAAVDSVQRIDVSLLVLTETINGVLNEIESEKTITSYGLSRLSTALNATVGLLSEISQDSQESHDLIKSDLDSLTKSERIITQRLYSSIQILSDALGKCAATSELDLLENKELLTNNMIVMAVAELNVLTKSATEALQRNHIAINILSDAMSRCVSESEVSAIKTTSLTTLSMIAETLSSIDGFDPDAAGSSPATEVTPRVFAMQDPERVVRIDISSLKGVPNSKDDGEYFGECKINIDGTVFSTFSSIAVQGSSSAVYPKKNLTLAFYLDDNYDKTHDLKIGDGMAFDEWVFKANYIDTTHSRNVTGYRLWAEMQDSRDVWPKREIDHYYIGKTGLSAIDTGATGVPKGYPCVVYINNVFYGVGDLMIGKKRGNYNISKNVANEIYLELVSADITTLDVSNDKAVEVKAPSSITDEFNGYIQGWRDFANLPQAQFTASLPVKMDVVNVIDYYILMQFLCAVDCINRNMLMISWTGDKWFMMPYDLDTTFGLNPGGDVIQFQPNYDPIVDGAIHEGNKVFWAKVKNAIGSDMNVRYSQLRDAGVLSLANTARIINNLQSKYNFEMFNLEFAKWPNLPSRNITSRAQMMEWLEQRLTWLDIHFSYSKEV